MQMPPNGPRMPMPPNGPRMPMPPNGPRQPYPPGPINRNYPTANYPERMPFIPNQTNMAQSVPVSAAASAPVPTQMLNDTTSGKNMKTIFKKYFE